MWVAANLIPSTIKFLTGPAGRYALLGLAFLAWGAYQRIDATQNCEEEELRRQLEESNRQLVIAQGIAEDARKRADEAQVAITELRGLADDLANDITEEGSGCALDDDTRERLLRIR